MIVAVFLGMLLGAGLSGLAMTGSRAKRTLLVVVGGIVAIVVPYLLRNEPLLARTFMAFALVTLFVRQVDLAFDKRAIPAMRRFMHATLVVELRRTPRVPSTFASAAFIRFVGEGALSVAAFTILWTVVPAHSLGIRALRWFVAVVAAYTSWDALSALFMLQWRALGFAIPPLNNDPIKSRTVSEFWFQRWNLTVGAWLREHCFMPLARKRRPLLGTLAAFVASTLIHLYAAWASLSLAAGLSWAAFFMLQIPIVLTERALRIASWPPVLARVWTVGVLLVASPLFVNPLLDGIEVLRHESSDRPAEIGS